MFDGNWLEKGDREVEDEDMLKHVMEKVEQNHNNELYGFYQIKKHIVLLV
jgi:hypothetical protein